MLMDWTKNVKDDKEKLEFESSMWSAKPVLERLKTLVNERVYNLDQAEMSVKDFETPNWAERQAFRNGFRSFANIVNKLITLDQKDN